MIKAMFLVSCLLFLMGPSCEEQVNTELETKGHHYERGTVKALQKIREELVLFRKKCSCVCPARRYDP